MYMMNQSQIRNRRVSTLSEIKAIANANEKTLCFCDATGRDYRFVLSGAAYTANDDTILTTGAGGDSRWISNEEATGGDYVQGTAMFFPVSGDWTVPYSGKYRIGLLGAGGSGGAIFTTTTGGAASGGGGAAFCEDEVSLVAGDVLTNTIGAGAGSDASSVSGTGKDGVDGGDTTVVCAARSLSMTAGGGKKGTFTATNSETINGGDGGTASGGSLHATGGTGGDAEHLTNGCESSGGGASGSPYGTGGNGGSAIAATTAIVSAAGGGAVGGFRGGNVTVDAKFAGGAGTGGNGTDDGYGGGPNKMGSPVRRSADNVSRGGTQDDAPCFDILVDPFRGLTGGGGDGDNDPGAVPGGPGSGSGGFKGESTTNSRANVCGGGGGNATSGGASTSAPGGLGGGSGGAATNLTGPATSGAGGNGLVIIERIG